MFLCEKAIMNFKKIAESLPLTKSVLKKDWLLLCDDSFSVLSKLCDLNITFPLIFADPPYFLSNGGITCHAGKMVSVNKGQWDKGASFYEIRAFHLRWIEKCLTLLDTNGTIWISATQHSIFIIGNILQELGCSIINVISWEKPNPPPNLSCRFFTHSTELLIWAKNSKKSKHCFNYEEMKAYNHGKQMKTVWTIPSPSRQEKIYGKHPTQKPIELLRRIVLASSNPGDVVLDPFAGSATTGVAALKTGRQFVGIELSPEFVMLSTNRLNAIEDELSQPTLL
jgi:site-specific DNA-methyltransferase (adenine-specific)